MLTRIEFFERALFSLILGTIILIIFFIFYLPYFKGKKQKPIYGLKREKRTDYLKDGIKILMYSRMKGFLYFGLFLILLSLAFFILGLIY